MTTCVVEFLDGKHAGAQVNVVSSSMYMWGYNLGKANLNSLVKHGDRVQVDYTVKPDEKDEDWVKVVKKCYFDETRREKAVRPSQDKKFSVFLSNRGADETLFLKWVFGESTGKPYFPFVADVYEGTVKEFVRDQSTQKVVGISVENLSKVLCLNKNGSLANAIAQDPEEKESHEEFEPAPPGIDEDVAEPVCFDEKTEPKGKCTQKSTSVSGG